MSEKYYESLTPLTPKENEDSEGAQNTYNAEPSCVTRNEISFDFKDKDNIMCQRIIPFAIFLPFLLIITSVLVWIEKNIFLRIIFAMPALFCIISYFLYLYLKPKKLNIIRNESYNLLTVKIINFLNCSKSTMNFNLQNVALDIMNLSLGEGEFKDASLVITNTFTNGIDIDLNLSNIKKKPIKNIYHIFDINPSNYNTISLRKFFNISPDIENPIIFSIYKYMGKSYNSSNSSEFKFLLLSRYMKMSENYFSYYLEKPSCYCRQLNGFICIIFAIPITLFFASLFIFSIIHSRKLHDDETLKISIATLIIQLSIASIIIIINIVFIKIYSLRIDIIYSQNFDTIFIALLNHNGTAYKKTFIHDMKSIERFLLESYDNSNSKFILKVEYKDKNIENILRIDEKYSLEGLLFILNKNLTTNQ